MKVKLDTLHLLDRLSADLSGLRAAHIPSTGWLQLVRRSLGKPLDAVAKEAKVSRQAIFAFESREAAGTLPIGRLAYLAQLLGCQMQYGLYSTDPAVLQRLAEVAQKKSPRNFKEDKEPVFPDYMQNSGMPPRGWLKRTRLSLGITQVDLAKKIGLTRQSLINLEKSEVVGLISLRNLRKIAQAMGYDLVYFLVNDPKVAPSFVERFKTEK